jgi:hypothetical protein
MRLAIEEAGYSRPEDDRPHPKVDGVVGKNGSITVASHAQLPTGLSPIELKYWDR